MSYSKPQFHSWVFRYATLGPQITEGPRASKARGKLYEARCEICQKTYIYDTATGPTNVIAHMKRNHHLKRDSAASLNDIRKASGMDPVKVDTADGFFHFVVSSGKKRKTEKVRKWLTMNPEEETAEKPKRRRITQKPIPETSALLRTTEQNRCKSVKNTVGKSARKEYIGDGNVEGTNGSSGVSVDSVAETTPISANSDAEDGNGEVVREFSDTSEAEVAESVDSVSVDTSADESESAESVSCSPESAEASDGTSEGFGAETGVGKPVDTEAEQDGIIDSEEMGTDEEEVERKPEEVAEIVEIAESEEAEEPEGPEETEKSEEKAEKAEQDGEMEASEEIRKTVGKSKRGKTVIPQDKTEETSLPRPAGSPVSNSDPPVSSDFSIVSATSAVSSASDVPTRSEEETAMEESHKDLHRLLIILFKSGKISPEVLELPAFFNILKYASIHQPFGPNSESLDAAVNVERLKADLRDRKPNSFLDAFSRFRR